MDKKTFNQQFARLVVSKNIVSREQVQACGRELGPNRNLGQILVSKSLISPAQYRQIMAYFANKYGYREETTEPSQPVSQPVRTTPQQAPQQASQPISADAVPEPGQRVIQPKSRKKAMDINVEELPRAFREPEVQGQPAQAPHSVGPRSSLLDVLIYGRKIGASDIHISPDSPIRSRRFGRLEPITQELLTAKDIQNMVEDMLNPYQLEELKTTGDLEFAETIPGHGRYRMTFAEQRFGWDFSCRIIDRDIRTWEEVGMPEAALGLTQWAQGLVLITGPLGCGKSATMATLVEQINAGRNEHIITIENPIELMYKPKKSQITQREVNRHTLSPGNALRGALRQDPDILVVGELRDLETIRLAVSAAETGHLVFGTMNTNNATRTINRLIDSFPTNEQEIMRTMISESLRGVISQQLIPRKEGSGVVPAFELLLVTKAISNLIRKDSMHQVESAMVSGRSLGMVLLDNSLKELVEKGIIDGQEAFYRASNPKNFKDFAPPELKEMLDV